MPLLVKNLLKKFFSIRRGITAPFIDTIEDEKNLQTIRLKGDIDMTTIPRIERLIWEAKRNRGLMNKNILLDFKKVNHVDSATIAALLVMLSDLQHEKHKLGLVNIPKQLTDMIHILECRDIFSVYSSERKARAELLEFP